MILLIIINNKDNKHKEDDVEEVINDSENSLGKEYLGVSSTKGVTNNNIKYQFSDSIHMVITHNKNNGNCTAVITETELSKQVDGYNNINKIPKNHVLYEWVNTLAVLTTHAKGIYESSSNILKLLDISSTKEECNWNIRYMQVYKDRLIGVNIMKEKREDLDDPLAPVTFNLKRII